MPTVPLPQTLTFRCRVGLYVCVEQGGDDVGLLVANRPVAAGWETFKIVPVRTTPEGQVVAIETEKHRYWSAQGGGGGEIVANRALRDDLTARSDLRTAIGGWEEFYLIAGGGGVHIKTVETGHYVRAVDGGGGALLADRTSPGVDETFNVPPSGGGGGGGIDPGVPTTARKGIVRANRHVLFDDDGSHLFVGFTFFVALWMYWNDRPRLEKTLAWIRDTRAIDYIRILGSVGGAFFSERKIDPTKPSYEADLAALLDLVASYGLRTQITIFGGGGESKTERKRVTEIVARVVAARPEKVFAVEVANEAPGTFPDGSESELRDLTKFLQSKIPNLVAVSAPSGDTCADQTVWYGGKVGSMVTLHLRRGQSGDGGVWDPMTQPWRGAAFRCSMVAEAYSSNEPIGPQSSVRAESDPRRLASLALTTFLSGMGAHVLHTGTGVRSLADPARNRPADFWEIPRIDEIVAGLRTVRSLLPPNLPNWARTGSQSPLFTGVRYRSVNAGPGTVDRIYVASTGTEFCGSVISLRERTPITVTRAMQLKALDLLTGAVIQEATLAKGQTMTLEGASGGTAVLLRGIF